jgi:hypothetical protein
MDFHEVVEIKLQVLPNLRIPISDSLLLTQSYNRIPWNSTMRPM